MTTNEEAKQAGIIKAWGEYWPVMPEENQNEALSSNGWTNSKIKVNVACFSQDESQFFLYKSGLPKMVCDYKKPTNWTFFIRPISIRNIEDNNGWTRIEPDGSNIPGFALYITDSKGTPMFTKNLPKGSPGLFEWCEDGKPQIHFMNAHQIKARWMRNQMGSPVGKITHFKKWEPSKPPVY